MPFSVEARATLHFPTPPDNYHLFVILTNPVPPAGQVLMVPICTVRKNHDGTCILQPGDHVFIQHESYVAYAKCRVDQADTLHKGIDTGLITDRGLLAEKVFARILAGAKKSSQIKPFAQELLEPSS